MQSSYGTKYGSVVPLIIFLERNPILGDIVNFKVNILPKMDYCVLLKNNNPEIIFIGKDIKSEIEEKFIRKEVNQIIIDKNITDYPPKTQHFFQRGLRQITYKKENKEKLI